MPSFHAQPCTDTPTKHSHSEECGLLYAPFGFPGPPFVDTVHEESDHVDDNEVDQDDMLVVFHTRNN